MFSLTSPLNLLQSVTLSYTGGLLITVVALKNVWLSPKRKAFLFDFNTFLTTQACSLLSTEINRVRHSLINVSLHVFRNSADVIRLRILLFLLNLQGKWCCVSAVRTETVARESVSCHVCCPVLVLPSSHYVKLDVFSRDLCSHSDIQNAHRLCQSHSVLCFSVQVILNSVDLWIQWC